MSEIVEVIGRYVKLEKDGIHYKACCPFHTEKTPSFYVNEAKNIWHCFGCHRGGDLNHFLTIFGKEHEPELVRLAQTEHDEQINREMGKLYDK